MTVHTTASARPAKHYTASVLILTDARPAKTLLLHHRKLDKWMQPGGHQEPHESPYETAIREVLEETGLDITSYLERPRRVDDIALALPLPGYILEEYIDPYGDEPEHYHLDITYVVRLPEQAVTHAELEAHTSGWFTAGQIADLPMFDNLRTILNQELAK
jgi:8-oxo-dGTP pyrophosphatase MutT (NUDIX family)